MTARLRDRGSRATLIATALVVLSLGALADESPPTGEAPEEGAAALPASGDAKAPAAAEEAKPAKKRTKLLIIPDAILQRAAEGDVVVSLGPQLTTIYGNAARFRRYVFSEPARPLVLRELHALGTLDGDDVMYDAYARTPLEQDTAAGLELRDFDGATTLRGDWQRYRFFRDFGTTANPSTRSDARALLSTRISGRGWLDVIYVHRDFASPALTSRPVAFGHDELGASTNWRLGSAAVGASLWVGRYIDSTAPLSVGGGSLTANRATVRFGLSAASLSRAEIQWSAALNAGQSSYPGVAGGLYSYVSAGAGVRYRASPDLALRSAVGYRRVGPTVTSSGYNPDSTTVRVSGTYTGIRDVRASFGYERRMGTRLATLPVSLGGTPFTEYQTVDRLWLTAGRRSRNGVSVDLDLENRALRGDVTSYLVTNPLRVPILLYPNQTTAELTAAHRSGVGLLRAGAGLGLHTNPARASGVRSFALTGMWSKDWSDRISTLVQAERIAYDNASAGSAGIDTDMLSLVGAATWSFRNGSANLSYGAFRSTGSLDALYQNWQAAVEYQPNKANSLFRLTYEHRSETGTGALAYGGHVVMLDWKRTF